MSILVLCDDYWHPAKVAREGLSGLESQGYQFDFIEDARAWSPQRMAEYPLVMLVKSDNVSAGDQTRWMTEEVQAAFREYVAGGGCLLAVHSGTVANRQVTSWSALLGGLFDHHPQQCPVTVEAKAGHPLVKGFTPFTQMDEHYFMNMEAGADVDIFLTSTSEHGPQPAGWTRREGAGNVCVLTPGHNTEVWKEASFQLLLKNIFAWMKYE